MVLSCCAYNCKNRFGKLREDGKKLQFHRFPLHNSVLLHKWILALKRKDFEPTKYTVICGDHFIKDNYKSKACHHLKSDAVPSIFNFSSHLQTVKKNKPLPKQCPLPVSTSLNKPEVPASLNINQLVSRNDHEPLKATDLPKITTITLAGDPKNICMGDTLSIVKKILDCSPGILFEVSKSLENPEVPASLNINQLDSRNDHVQLTATAIPQFTTIALADTRDICIENTFSIVKQTACSQNVSFQVSKSLDNPDVPASLNINQLDNRNDNEPLKPTTIPQLTTIALDGDPRNISMDEPLSIIKKTSACSPGILLPVLSKSLKKPEVPVSLDINRWDSRNDDAPLKATAIPQITTISLAGDPKNICMENPLPIVKRTTACSPSISFQVSKSLENPEVPASLNINQLDSRNDHEQLTATARLQPTNIPLAGDPRKICVKHPLLTVKKTACSPTVVKLRRKVKILQDKLRLQNKKIAFLESKLALAQKSYIMSKKTFPKSDLKHASSL